MKIYTRTGDDGETGLFAGGRVPKDDPRVEAYGEVDELNSVLGVALTALGGATLNDVRLHLGRIQDDLLAIGAHLATPGASTEGPGTAHLPPLPLARIDEMERWIDDAESELEPLREFILPGGSAAAAQLHVARTVCRRAERRVVSLSRVADLDPAIVRFLNRLSDLLFTYARLANRREDRPDVKWRRERDNDEG